MTPQLWTPSRKIRKPTLRETARCSPWAGAMDADGGGFVGLQCGDFFASPNSLLGLALWLRADMGITIATGVSVWADQSGQGDSHRNCAQVTGGNQPTLLGGGIVGATYNYHPVVFFNGTTDYLVSGTWSTPLVQPFTTFVVGHSTSGTNSLAIDNLAAHQTSVQSNAANYQIYAGTTSLNSGIGSWGSHAVTCSVFNGANSQLFFSQKTGQTPGSTGTNNMTGTTVGGLGSAPGNTTNSWSGPIAEIIIYSRLLPNTEIVQVMNYLGSWYAIPIAS